MKHDIVEHTSNHFECRRCHRIWETNPRLMHIPRCYEIPVSSKHDLIQSNPGHFECRACYQTWQAKPRSRCPGIRLYTQYGHEPLLTKLQLGYAGYEIATLRLPPPVGCFQSRSGYVLLYDPRQATPKQTPHGKRKTITITDIFWPLDSIYFIEEYMQGDSFNLQNEAADMAYHIRAFTGSEVERLVGNTLHSSIAACLVNISFAEFQRSSSARAILIKSIVAAYQNHKAAP